MTTYSLWPTMFLHSIRKPLFIPLVSCVFVNKVFLGHSSAHSFMNYRWLLSHYQGRVQKLQQRPSALQNMSDKHFLYAKDGNMDCFINFVDETYEFGTIFIPIL